MSTANQGQRKKSSPRSSTKKSSAKKTAPKPQGGKPAGPEVIRLNDGRVVVDGVVYESETKAPEPVPESKPRAPKYYIRNLRHVEVWLRFESQDKDKQRTKLAPRGQRQDFTALRDEWRDDPILIQNLKLGVIEIINQAEADQIVETQYAGVQELHPALAVIQNQQGDDVSTVEIDDPQAQDIPVAPLVNADGEGTGQVTFDQQGNIARPVPVAGPSQVSDPYTGTAHERLSGQAPVQVAAPGSELAPTPRQVEPVDPEAIESKIAELRDQLARSKNVSGPGAGVAGLSVEVEPTQRG